MRVTIERWLAIRKLVGCENPDPETCCVARKSPSFEVSLTEPRVPRKASFPGVPAKDNVPAWDNWRAPQSHEWTVLATVWPRRWPRKHSRFRCSSRRRDTMNARRACVKSLLEFVCPAPSWIVRGSVGPPGSCREPLRTSERMNARGGRRLL